MANKATVRNAYGVPAMFAGSKTGSDDAAFVFVRAEMRSAVCDGPNGTRFPPGPGLDPPGDRSLAARYPLSTNHDGLPVPSLGCVRQLLSNLPMAMNSSAYKFVSKDRPPCSRCGRPLILTRIESSEPGFDMRTYFCAYCADQETVVAPA